jgi:hypothetical protein
MLETLPESPVPNALFQIVGVVSDMRNDGIRDPVRPEVLLPYTATGFFMRGILVRTAGPPMPLANSVRREIWAADPGVAIAMTRTLDDFLSDYASPRRACASTGWRASRPTPPDLRLGIAGDLAGRPGRLLVPGDARHPRGPHDRAAFRV